MKVDGIMISVLLKPTLVIQQKGKTLGYDPQYMHHRLQQTGMIEQVFRRY